MLETTPPLPPPGSFQEEQRLIRLGRAQGRMTEDEIANYPYDRAWVKKLLGVDPSILIYANVLRPLRLPSTLVTAEWRFSRANLIQAYIVLRLKRDWIKLHPEQAEVTLEDFNYVPIGQDGLPTKPEHLKYLQTKEGLNFISRLDAPRLSI